MIGSANIVESLLFVESRYTLFWIDYLTGSIMSFLLEDPAATKSVIASHRQKPSSLAYDESHRSDF